MMKLVKQQRFNVEGRKGCASIYEYEPAQPNLSESSFAISIYVEGKNSFVNRTIRTRAKAEKIYNQQLDKMKVEF